MVCVVHRQTRESNHVLLTRKSCRHFADQKISPSYESTRKGTCVTLFCLRQCPLILAVSSRGYAEFAFDYHVFITSHHKLRLILTPSNAPELPDSVEVLYLPETLNVLSICPLPRPSGLARGPGHGRGPRDTP